MTRASVLVVILAAAACRRPHPHASNPCASLLKLARADASNGYLERAISALERSPRTCPGAARLREGWIAEGRAGEGGSEGKYLIDAAAADAKGDPRAARVLYARAIDALNRAGDDWLLSGVVSTATGRSPWSFSTRKAWFLEGTTSSETSTLTAWSPETSHQFSHLADQPTAAAITPSGRVVFAGSNALFAWSPATSTTRALGIGDPIPSAFPGGVALDVSPGGDALAWHSVVHRPDAPTVATLDSSPLTVVWSADGRTLWAATSDVLAEYDLTAHYDLGTRPIRSLKLPAGPPRDVALTHDGRVLISRDEKGLHRYRVSPSSVDLVASFPVPFGHQAHQQWGRPGQLVISPSDKWLLLRGHGASGLVYSIANLGGAPCAHGDVGAVGFMSYRDREWLVAPPRDTHAATWRLTALPESGAGCNDPITTIELTRLDAKEHGIAALQRVTRVPCSRAEDLACPPTRVRTTVELLWVPRSQADAWFASHLRCHAGGRAIPNEACLLHYAR